MTMKPPDQKWKIAKSEMVGSYLASPHTSIKHSSYFQVYEDLFSRYRNEPVVFVEIGVLDGGSLFMWRGFLGQSARIIGVDLNPDAKRWEAEGFEIYIGSQEDPVFWQGFFADVGMVDVVVDDGGHTNSQQIVTAQAVLPHIRDGGMLVVEDVHASYQRKFGNPSRFSFISYCKKVVDHINSRSSVLPKMRRIPNIARDCVYSCAFYESIVCFHIDRQKCFISEPTTNNGAKPISRDYRFEKYETSFDPRKLFASGVRSLSISLAELISVVLFGGRRIILEKLSSWRMRKHF